MRESRVFGGEGDRSPSGDLLSAAILKVAALLRGGGLLLAETWDGWVLFKHPDVATPTLPDDHEVLHYGSIEQLEGVHQLNLGERRVLEACTPGALVVTLGAHGAQCSVTVPDTGDLRELALSLGRPLATVGPLAGQPRGAAETRLSRIISESDRDHLVAELTGVAVSQSRPTTAWIGGPRDVKVLAAGAVDAVELLAASDRVSQWEIEDWT